jgi:hypothetical protein
VAGTTGGQLWYSHDVTNSWLPVIKTPAETVFHGCYEDQAASRAMKGSHTKMDNCAGRGDQDVVKRCRDIAQGEGKAWFAIGFPKQGENTIECYCMTETNGASAKWYGASKLCYENQICKDHADCSGGAWGGCSSAPCPNTGNAGEWGMAVYEVIAGTVGSGVGVEE